MYLVWSGSENKAKHIPRYVATLSQWNFTKLLNCLEDDLYCIEEDLQFIVNGAQGAVSNSTMDRPTG